MKKYTFLAAFFLLCTLLAACGKKDSTEESTWQGIAPGTDDLTAITERTEYYDVTVKAEELFDLGLWEKNRPNLTAESTALIRGKKGYLLVGMQFFMGEPVQLWAELSLTNADIYLYRNDGTRELLQGVTSSYTRTSSTISNYKWYLSREKDLYCYHSVTYVEENRAENVVVKFLPTGEPLYCSMLDPDFFIHDFRQMDDGRIYLLLQDKSKDSLWFLAELDPATGELLADSRIELPYTFSVNLGAAGDSPAVTGQSLSDPGDKIMKVDTADGSLSPVLYFTGTSYGWHEGVLWTFHDLQVLEDGSIELLWADHNGKNCLWESLRMEKVEKTPIIVRGIDNNEWLADRIAMFNRENSTCHVILETCGDGNDGEDFSRLTNIQLGSGKGPDILLADLDLDFTELMEKGVLEDLFPYMEASGVREEDYFPLVFAAWRQGEHIYSVNYLLDALGGQIDEEVLGSRETPDIGTLADALLAWEGDGIYRSGYDSGAVLKQFLLGTETLWGMVDWENGCCDFNTPLFGKLLEAARRYGDDGRSAMKSRIAYDLDLASFFWFDGQAEQEAEKKVTYGVLFDDGCYPASSSEQTLTVNANSPNKEGAWKFISYLIGKECQGKEFLFHRPPVQREVFKEWLSAMIERWGIKHYVNGVPVLSAYYGTDVSEEKQAEYIKAIEEARPLPTRTAPILTIILDEAEAYFDGYKSAEEVSKTINNRVQLYLDERK